MKTPLLRLAAASTLLALAPAATAGFTSTIEGTTLILRQTSNEGTVTIDDNGAAGAFRLLEGITTELVVADSLVVELLSNSHALLTIDLDSPMVRDLTLDLADGVRTVQFTGDANAIGGHLRIDAGANTQLIELAFNNPLVVDGGITIDLGAGNDQVEEDGNSLTTAGDLVLRDVDVFLSEGPVTVVGDVSFKNPKPPTLSSFDARGTIVVLGDFTYVGGADADRVYLDDGATIGCNLTVEAGPGITADFSEQLLHLDGARVGGNVTFTSGATTEGGEFITDAATRIGGKVAVSLGGGGNTVDLRGRYGAGAVVVKGGKGDDVVTLDAVGRGTKFKLDLGGGADTLTLEAGTSVRRVIADFGKGVDTFTDNYGDPKPFTTKTTALP